jgi:hypothetical protein
MKKYKLISFVSLLFLFIFSSGQGICSNDEKKVEPLIESDDKQLIDDTRTELLSKIKPLIELITSEKPSLDEAIKLLGGQAKENVKDKWYIVDGLYYHINLRIMMDGEKALVRDVVIYTGLDMEMEFNEDIVPILGKKWKELLPIRKAGSLASFSYTNSQTGKKAEILIQVYTYTLKPPAPVTRIHIMIEGPQQ